MLLAIDTATKQLGVAVSDGERLLASYALLAEYPHGVELAGSVQRVLKEARTTLAQLDAIAVDIGPGSFTGLRIGLAFVKALAFSAKKPVVGVPSLDVLAAGIPFSTQEVCPILDAKQKNVYAACYPPQGQTLPTAGIAQNVSDTSRFFLGPVEKFLARLTEPALFIGDGCALYREPILTRCPQAQFAPQELWLPNPATLARLAACRFAEGWRDDPATLTPLYLYPLDCSVRGPNRPTAVLPLTNP